MHFNMFLIAYAAGLHVTDANMTDVHMMEVHATDADVHVMDVHVTGVNVYFCQGGIENDRSEV